MSDVDQDQKTEAPSEKKVSEAFEQGQFAKSTEIQLGFLLAGFLAAFAFSIHETARGLTEMAIGIFSQIGTLRVQLDSIASEAGNAVFSVGKLLVPVMLACAVAAVLAGGLQSGFRISTKAFRFRPETLNPMAGFQRLFSKAAFVQSGIEFLKLIAIAVALWGGVRALFQDPLFSSPVEAAYLGDFIYRATVTFLSRFLLALGIIAAISYSYELFKTRRQLMMTKEEVKDERKQSEGDGKTKGAMRRMARRLVQKQMLSAVPTADVIITNPTHFAVALKYERGSDKAPVVLAKGENQFARRIKAIAAENGVPMVENKPVARMLFAMGKVGEVIPVDLYQVVAEILAVVYRTHRYYFYQLKMRRNAQA